MNSLRTYGIALTLALVLTSGPCYAPTDWVVNTIDYANGLVKDAGSVQEEYAGYANQYIQNKTGSLGDVNAAKKKKDKAKKLKDRADKYKAKAKKMKALADKAKEKKAALEAEAKKLQDKADEIKEKYDAAKAKIDEAKDKYNEVKDKVDEAKDKYNEVKDKVDEAKDKINEAKETASGLKDAAKAKAGLESGAAVEEMPGTISAQDVEQTPLAPEPQVTPLLPQTDTVTALQELTAADAAVTTEIAVPSLTPADGLTTELSVDEVVELADTPAADVAAVAEPLSEFNLEEQLLMADQLKAKQREETAAPKLSNEELRGRLRAGDEAKLESLRQSRRRTFGSAPAALKEIADE